MVFYKKTLLALRCMSDKKVDWPIAFLSGIGNLVPRAFSSGWGWKRGHSCPTQARKRPLALALTISYTWPSWTNGIYLSHKVSLIAPVSSPILQSNSNTI